MGEAVEVGSTANNYQILARLATGGMAEIFLARGVSATGVERYCVLKRILRNRASDVSFVRMFLDEARLAAQLQHPNVAQVYDIGKLGDSYFFTMEYVHGETVRAIMQRARSLRRDVPLASVLTIIAGAAAGLHHAHDRIGVDGRPLNIVHRDVSPSNLMVSYEGSVKVVDFGVAKASDRANETRSGTVKGKISYLSPEQARGSSSIDRRSDLFSLGIVMWEMLTTERLYKRSGDFENMTAIVNEPPPPPSSRKPSIPPELDAITLKLLSKDPAERFQNADELIEALEGFAAKSGTMISSSALARFLRDMFGQRPEPWVEMDTVEAPEGVTVTSEPIPGELAIPVDADADLALDRVPRLDLAKGLERPIPQIDDDHLMATPLIGVTDVDQIPTRPHPKLEPPMMTTLSDASPPPPGIVPPPSAPPRVQSPLAQTIAGIGSQPRLGGSGSHARIPATAATPESTAANIAHAQDDEPSRGVGWQLLAVVAIAAIVGSLTMWLVMRNSGRSEVAATRDAAVAAAPAREDVAVPSRGDIATRPIDAAVAAIEIDAAVAAVAIDAAVAPAAPVDAAVAVASATPAHAAVVADPPDTDAKPADKPRPEVKEPKVDPKRPKKSEIETAWDSGNYRDIVTRCAKSFPAPPDDVRCVLAACKVESENKARVFFAKIDKSRRRGLINACRNADVELEPAAEKPDKPDKKDCEKDPMSCQH